MSPEWRGHAGRGFRHRQKGRRGGDLDDPAIPIGIPGIRWLPFYYCFDFRANDLGYRLVSEESLVTFFPDDDPNVTHHEEWPAEDYPLANRFLASCYAHAGRLEEAREVVVRLRAITPVIVPATTNYRDPVHRELFLSGLRAAAGAALLGQKQVTPPL